MQQRTVGVLFTVLAATLFGTLGIFGKQAIAVNLSVTGLLASRFLVVALPLWVVLLAGGDATRPSWRVLGSGLGLGVDYGWMSLAYFEGLTWLSAGVATLLLFTYPVQVTVASALLFEEPLTVSKLLRFFAFAATAGVPLIVGDDSPPAATPGIGPGSC